MCGRFVHISYLDNLRDVFPVEEVDIEKKEPNYNAAPTQQVPVVVQLDMVRLTTFRWGLVPFWADDEKIGNRLINARAESVFDKPAFRAAAKRRRCLVAADGYYEWKKTGDGRQPWFIRPESGAPFGLAGIWERWEGGDRDEPLLTCAILTTDATGLAADIHDRMPVILPPEAYGKWLDPDNDDRDGLSRILSDELVTGFTGHPVSRRVNSPKNNGPELIEPAE
ncbi:MAG: SOS response-associated peptidase [Desulfatibacillaceae bacterium]